MVDQARVTSGFDIESMVGERALSAVLMTLVESGSIPASLRIEDPPLDFNLYVPNDIKRLYDPNPDAELPEKNSLAFKTVILFNHPSDADLRVTAVFGYTNRETNAGWPALSLDLLVRLTFTTTRAEGAIDDARLGVELVDLEGDLLPFLEAEFGTTEQDIIDLIKPYINQDLDLGSAGSFKRIDDIAIRKMEADGEHPPAYGLFLNMKLKDGPEPDAFLGPRGDVNEATNFLPEGSDTAFATRSDIFGDVGKDQYERKAQPRKSGGYTHPLHRSPSNPDSAKIGKIDSISVDAGGPLDPFDQLRIVLSGELDALDEFFDPDVTMTITLTPVMQSTGELQWAPDTDVSVDTIFEFLPMFTLWMLLILFGPAGLVAGLIMIGTLFVVDTSAGLIAAALLSSKVERKVDATLFDIRPDRLSIAKKRWDPYYSTAHQVVTLPDGIILNNDGIALWGKVAVGREIEPIAHTVIRDKLVDGDGTPTHLLYRINDAEEHVDTLTSVAPGSDRRPFTQPDPANDPTLFAIGIDDIVARIAEKRIQPNIPYMAAMIDLTEGQIEHIKAISEREINELRNRLIGAFEDERSAQILAESGAELRQEAVDELAAEGIATPTEEQIQEKIDGKIARLVERETIDFKEDVLPDQLNTAVQEIVRFDLEPSQFATLQKLGILSLTDTFHDGKPGDTYFQVIEIDEGPGKGTVYYRDAPRFGDTKEDNLLSLPQYNG